MSTMTTKAPLRARQSYRHEAYLWHSRAEFVEGLVPFVREGIDAGEAVIVGLTAEHAWWLREELGDVAGQVIFVDLVDLGRNPARIIPALQEFLASSCGPGRPARAVGETIWAGRGPEEIRECELHEALLNLAVDPHLPFWLLCLYDAEQLAPAVLNEAARSHPAIATATSYEGSGRYRGQEHAEVLFADQLPRRTRPAATIPVTGLTLAAAMETLTWQAASSDLFSDRVVVLAEVVRGLAVEALHRGANRVRVKVWDEPQTLVCEVADRAVIRDFLVGRRQPPCPEQHSVWFANQVCDLVQLRSSEHGTTIRLHLQK